jgi:hypothetical protein
MEGKVYRVKAREGLPEVESVRSAAVRRSVWPEWGRIPRSPWHLFLGWKAFYEIYAAFVAAFREASERLLRGDRNAPFPIGSFPPALPFVAG